jgi:hypothetical protein
MLAAPPVEEISTVHLAPAVTNQLGRGPVTILDFHIEQIKGGIGNPVSLGLFRASYEVMVDDQQKAGTMILKVIQSPANVGLRDMGGGGDRRHWNYWQRELLFYQSELVNLLPLGLVVPVCYGTVSWANDVAWLWLEDLGPWYTDHRPLAGLETVAGALGRLNGRYFGPDRLPRYDWFSQNQLAQMVSRIPGPFQNPLFAGVGRPRWDHPLLANLFSPADDFRLFLDRIDDVLAALDRLPPCWCHGDGNPYNFVVRPGRHGDQEVVAMDWALTGIGTPGKDLAQLVGGSLELIESANTDRAIHALFDAYTEGLAEGGWQGDNELVWFGYAAAAAIDYGLFFVFFLGLGLDGSNLAITDQQRASVRFINDVSRQALALLGA